MPSSLRLTQARAARGPHRPVLARFALDQKVHVPLVDVSDIFNFFFSGRGESEVRGGGGVSIFD